MNAEANQKMMQPRERFLRYVIDELKSSKRMSERDAQALLLSVGKLLKDKPAITQQARDAMSITLSEQVPCNSLSAKQKGGTCYLEAATNMMRRTKLRMLCLNRLQSNNFKEVPELQKELFKNYITAIFQNLDSASCVRVPPCIAKMNNSAFGKQGDRVHDGGNPKVWLKSVFHYLNIDVEDNGIKREADVHIFSKYEKSIGRDPDLANAPPSILWKDGNILKVPHPPSGIPNLEYIGALVSMQWSQNSETKRHAVAMLPCFEKEDIHIRDKVFSEYSDDEPNIFVALKNDRNEGGMIEVSDTGDDSVRITMTFNRKKEGEGIISKKMMRSYDFDEERIWMEKHGLSVGETRVYDTMMLCDSNTNVCIPTEKYFAAKRDKHDGFHVRIAYHVFLNVGSINLLF